MEHRNATEYVQVQRALNHRVDSALDGVWIELLTEMERQRAQQLDAPALGVAAAWRDGGTLRTLARVQHGGASNALPMAMIIGRHEECDVEPIPDASLRHAVVLGGPQDGSHAQLEVLDLNTASGLLLPNGERAGWVRGHSAVLVGVGSADVIAVFARPGQTFSQALHHNHGRPSSGPGRRRETLLPLPGRAEPATRPGERSWHAYFSRLARVRDEPAALLGWAGPAHQGFEAEDGTVRDAFGGGILHPGAWETVTVSGHELEQGVLLGRHDRCGPSPCMRADDRVSRVHALLLRRGNMDVVVDLGSTNGTHVLDGTRRLLERGNRVAALRDWSRLRLGHCSVEVRIR